MKKQTAVIIISLFLLVVAGLCTYLFYYYVGGSKALDNASFAFDNSDINKSIQLLEEKGNKSIDEQLLLAISYAQKGTIDFNESENAIKALDIVNKVLLSDPNNAEAFRVRGYAYEIQKQYDLAIEAYSRAILLDPQFALAYSSRGHAYDLKGDSEKAITDYRTALDIDGTLDHAELNIARVYFRNGNIEQATEYLNKVVDGSSNLSFKAAAEQILGVIDLSKENNSGAKIHFDSALTYDNMLTAAYVGRGEANFNLFFEELKKNPELQAEPVYDIVFEDINKALEINKNQVSALMLAYKLLIVSGDKEAAKQMLTMAEASVPNDITLGQIEKDAYLAHITSLKNSSN